LGLRRIPRPSFRTPGIRRILWLMAPRTAGLAVTQVNMVVLLALASALPLGSIAVFHLANNLQSFPVGIFGISFAVAAFPNLARSAGAKQDDEFQTVLSSAIRKVLFLMIPATAIFILLRAQIVRLALGAGIFGWTDTIRTADVLGVFAASMVVQGLVPLLARAFYALQDTWTPLIAGVIAEAFNLLLAVYLREPLGIVGLAIAFSIAAYLNLVLLWWLLANRKGSLGQGMLLLSGAKTVAASVALFGFGWIARQGIGTVFPLRTFWQVALQAGGTVVVGGAAFVVVAILLRSDELSDFKRAIKVRLLKKAVVQGAEEVQGV
jgi:putative peptidoglycan lipid II flippase